MPNPSDTLMYHARHADLPDLAACGARPRFDKILIWTDELAEVSCCGCLRSLGWRPVEIHPDRYERHHNRSAA